MDLPAYLAERAPRIDAALDALLPPAAAPPRELHEAMRHLVFPGGKRLRPMLAFATAEALGRPPEAALPAALAAELIHTYSLIHDDLPCMDDDDERRGRPTVHRAFGESTAVLAGDALQALAFESLVTSDAPPEVAAACVLEFSRAVGASGLVGGQVDDLAFEAGASEPPREQARRIESVHERKSAMLIAAAVACAGRLAGADDARVAGLRNAGLEVGVAFQIADDWLDREQDEACSLVRVLGPDDALALADQLLASALARCEDLGDAAAPLRELMRFAVHRSN